MSIYPLDLQCSTDDENDDEFQDTLSDEESPTHSRDVSTLGPATSVNSSLPLSEQIINTNPAENAQEVFQADYLKTAFIKTEMKQEPLSGVPNNSRGKTENKIT